MDWQNQDQLMEHYDRIKRYITYKAGVDQAEDLTQQVFLQANQSIHTFQNNSSLYTWLYAIASNAIMNEARRAYHTKELLEGKESSYSRFITTDFTKEVDFKIDLGTSLRKLDTIDQEILTLRYVADYSFRDIAKLLNLNESMVKNRVYRCLGKMRMDLESWHIVDPFNPKLYLNMVNMLETGQSGPAFQKVTDDFTAILRKNFHRITSALQFTPITKITYEIYPDQESMAPQDSLVSKSVIGQFGVLNVVKIVSPLNPGPYLNYDVIVNRSLALYTKALTHQLNPQLPTFLLHGVGEFIGQEWSSDQVRSRLTSFYRQREVPSIMYLRVMEWPKFSQMKGRELCYTLIDYIVTRHSWDALHRLLRDPGSLETIFSCTASQFEVDWKQFLMEQYLDKERDASEVRMIREQQRPKDRLLKILVPEQDVDSTKYRISSFMESAQAFESTNSGVQVTVETLPLQQFSGAKWLERMSGPHAVDLVFWPYDSEISKQGLFADLLPFYTGEWTASDDLFKPLTKMTTENGQLTAVPMSPQPLAVLYNKEWFDRANLPEPRGDWTWEQFLTVSVQLKEANKVEGKDIHGSAVPLIMDFVESVAQSSGSSILSPDNSRFTGYLDSRPVIEAFSLLLKAINKQGVVKMVPNGTAAIFREMSLANIGMGVGRIAVYLGLIRNRQLKDKIGIAPLPRLAHGVRANAVWIQGLSIVAASKQQHLAWKFIKDIILNPESEFHHAWSKQEMLTSRSSIRKLKLDDKPVWNVFMDELNYAVKPVIYRNPKLKRIDTANQLGHLAFLSSEEDIQREMMRAASEMDKRLADTHLFE